MSDQTNPSKILKLTAFLRQATQVIALLGFCIQSAVLVGLWHELKETREVLESVIKVQGDILDREDKFALSDFVAVQGEYLKFVDQKVDIHSETISMQGQVIGLQEQKTELLGLKIRNLQHTSDRKILALFQTVEQLQKDDELLMQLALTSQPPPSSPP